MSLEQVVSILREKKTFLVAGHIGPEGDAIGSSLALAIALRDMGKKADVINRDPIPRQLGFLPHEGILFQRDALTEVVDCLVVVDCADLRRTGFLEGKGTLPKTVVNIDHHVTNPLFGDVNWVVPEAVATGEMIYDLLKAMPVSITPPIATALYTALLSETGSFRYANTNQKSLRMGADLIDRGADPVAVARALFEINPLGKLELLGEVLTRLELSEDKKVAWVEVTRAQLQRTNTVDADTDDFISYPRSIEGIEAAVFFREVEPQKYKISLRSEGKVDVSLLAKGWGGGGHRNAAGCTILGNREEVKKKVLSSVQEAVWSVQDLSTVDAEREVKTK